MLFIIPLMQKHRKLILLMLLACAAADAFAAIVTVQGRKLFVDSRQFSVKGVCFSPIPAGYNWQYVWADVPSIYSSDLPLVKSMGATTVRTYQERQITQGFLDAAAANGLYVIVGWGEELWSKDFSNPATRAVYVNKFGDFVDKWKAHPAVLMWCFGNEVERHTDSPSGWFQLVQEAAAKAHSLDSNHPVGTDCGENTVIGVSALGTTDAALADLDIWLPNIYRGKSFGEFFTEMSTRTAKAYIVGEWGCDSYNGVKLLEDQSAQDEYIRFQWAEIAAKAAECAGGCVFEWSDEWWKGATTPGDASTLGQGGVNGTNSHDTAADWTNTAFDNDPNMNEEWWGLVTVAQGVLRSPRLAYYSLRELWSTAAATVSNASSGIIQGSIKSYPNPFIAGRDTARIEFTVTGEPAVEIAIFGLAGDKVFQLENIVDLGSGVRAADWTGKNDDGNFVPAGLYICRVKAKAGGREEVKYRKIAVVK